MALLDLNACMTDGREPFSTILEAALRLAPHETLEVILPFQPVPLYRRMENLGCDHTALRIEGNGWHITFERVVGD